MPGELRTPTVGEILQLPRWARVALAARCARRVLPLFNHFWPDTPEEHVRALETAVGLAEQSAVHAVTVHASVVSAADAAVAAHNAAYWGDCSDADDTAYITAHEVAAAVARSVARAAAAAQDAFAPAAYTADAAADAARAAYPSIPFPGVSVATPTIVKDFQTLLALAQTEKWTDATLVPPEVFGPLWPNGLPPGWPGLSLEEQQSDQAVIVSEPGTPNAIAERILEAFDRLVRAGAYPSLK